MKIENATIGLDVIVKNNFYIRNLCGVSGKIVNVTSGGVIKVVFDKKYPISLAAPNNTLGFNTNNYRFLPNHLRRAKI